MALEDLICGRYKKLRPLGQGGIAEVFLGLDLFSGRQVALKIAHSNDPEAADAIKSEFYFAIRHIHPSLANSINLIYIDKSPVIIMPFINGITPNENNGHGFWNRLDDEIIGKMIASMLEGAAFIHFTGHVYNDFKPQNYIFRDSTESESNPALIDFNLISCAGETPSKRGTIEYMAPEILQGKPSSAISDLYSLGATIFELFTDHPPYMAGENSSLIKLVTEDGVIDFAGVPETFQNGLFRLLARAPEDRPANVREAAELLGVQSQFDELYAAHISYYLACGNPPFFQELDRSVGDYISGKSEKAFVLSGLFPSSIYLNYVQARYTLMGYSVLRISPGQTGSAGISILNYLLAETSWAPDEKMLIIIDDIAGFSIAETQQLRALIRSPKNLPLVACSQRWEEVAIPSLIFDPLHSHQAGSATKEVLSAFLKTDLIPFDYSALFESTGGDPELIYLHLLDLIESGDFDLLAAMNGQFINPKVSPRIDDVNKRACGHLTEDMLGLLSILSVWGNSIPMILLSDFDEPKIANLEILLEKGYLFKSKDSISFFSGDMREYAYSGLLDNVREQYHGFWAELACKHLSEEKEYNELSAIHWGKSNDPVKGYEANLIAASELFGSGELARAKVYADTLLSLAERGGGSKAAALMLYADILKLEGNYSQARIMYLDLLRSLKLNDNAKLQAETFKDLGDLYRSIKKPRRALFYTNKALEMFGRLGMDQGVANCHNNIGLIFWVSQKYEDAFSSFTAAYEINKKLGNFQELAKIQSNIGIIKDILGQTSEVAAYFEGAYQDAQKASDPWLEALIANNLGYYFIRQNALDKAKKYLEEALQISKRIGYTENVVNSLTNLGLCNLRAGSLFVSIEFNQNAMEMAESLGNKHLSLDARLYLAEACILMGNFSLADNVLSNIESDNIYIGNKAFGGQVDLLRSWWLRSIGNYAQSLSLTDKVRDYAAQVKDHRLNLEAELASYQTLLLEGNCNDFLDNLKTIANQATDLGHLDLFDQAGLALSRLYLQKNELNNSENWAQRVLGQPNQTRRIKLEAQALLGDLKNRQGKFNESIEIISAIETDAAGSGFILIALEAAVILSEAYAFCGKSAKEIEISKRVQAYIDRLAATIPTGVTSEFYRNIAVVKRVFKKTEPVSDIEYR
jgi:serine/threonine protein kinase/tetratricopeptide (TPR) repeat protein